jgi:hypothetical protein
VTARAARASRQNLPLGRRAMSTGQPLGRHKTFVWRTQRGDGRVSLGMRIRLSEVVGSRDYNFDVLRLVAAGLVLVSHAFPLAGRHEPLAPHTLGTVGVKIFFVISGFLVTKSWLSDPSFRHYIGKRARRIFPGLVCAVLLTALVLGPIFSSRSPKAFLGSGAPPA